MSQPPSHSRDVLSNYAPSLLESIRERPTFTQAFGARMLHLLLWVICGLVVAFLLAWLSTRPTLTQVQGAIGATAEPKVVLETLRELQRDHAEQFRSFFQLLVLSGLVPRSLRRVHRSVGHPTATGATTSSSVCPRRRHDPEQLGKRAAGPGGACCGLRGIHGSSGHLCTFFYPVAASIRAVFSHCSAKLCQSHRGKCRRPVVPALATVPG